MISPLLDISPSELQDLFDQPAYEHDKGYQLIALNDDVTPFDYVIALFISVFDFNYEKAEEVATKIHNDGRASVFHGSEEECQAKKEVIEDINRQFNQHLSTIITKVE